MFRVKYTLTRRPMATLFYTTTLSWLCGTFILHVFEFQFTPSLLTWLVTSFDFLVGLGYGPLMPDTAVGRLAACYLTGKLTPLTLPLHHPSLAPPSEHPSTA